MAEQAASSTARQLWLGRAWSAIPLVVAALALAGSRPSWSTSAGLALVLAVELAAAVAIARLIRALAGGGSGDLLLKDGTIVPLAALRSAYRAEGAELAAAFASIGTAAAAVSWDGAADWVLFVLPTSVSALLALMFVVRRANFAVFAALGHLMRDDPQGARLAIRPALAAGPTLRRSAEVIETQIALREGRLDEARRRMEAAWSGEVDDEAALLGWLRIPSGEVGLAQRWLAAARPDRRYERYLAALLRGTLALHRRAWPEAIEAARATRDLPPWYVRQLALIEAAALQGAGRTAEAAAVLREHLGPEGLASYRWLAAAIPLQWRLLEDAAAGVATGELPGPAGSPPSTVTAPVPPPAGAGSLAANPFASPASPGAVAPRGARRIGTGAIPVESLAIGRHYSPVGTVLVLSLAAVLAALGGLLLGLWLLLVLAGSEVTLGFEPAVGLGAIGIALLIATERLVSPWLGSGPEAIALADGRRIGRRWAGTWTLVHAAAPAAAAAVFVAVPVVALLTGGVPWWAVLASALPGLLVGYGAWIRIVSLRLVRAVHFDPPPLALARAERLGARSGYLPGIRSWVGLARLWTGDVAGAARAWESSTTSAADRGLLAWLSAARGELDLERALAAPEPDELGDRYRRAVALALAALALGQPERVADRTEDWRTLARSLPNRFGRLLAHLAARVDHAANRGPAPEPDPELAWVERAGPSLAPPR